MFHEALKKKDVAVDATKFRARPPDTTDTRKRTIVGSGLSPFRVLGLGVFLGQHSLVKVWRLIKFMTMYIMLT